MVKATSYITVFITTAHRIVSGLRGSEWNLYRDVSRVILYGPRWRRATEMGFQLVNVDPTWLLPRYLLNEAVNLCRAFNHFVRSRPPSTKLLCRQRVIPMPDVLSSSETIRPCLPIIISFLLSGSYT